MEIKKEKRRTILLRLIPVFVFFITLVIHMFVTIWDNVRVLSNFGVENINYPGLYIELLGHLKGLSAAFITAYISLLITKYFQLKKDGVIYVLKGMLITIVLVLLLTFSFGFYTKAIEEFFINKVGWVYIPIRQRFFLIFIIIPVLSGYIYITYSVRKKIRK